MAAWQLVKLIQCGPHPGGKNLYANPLQNRASMALDAAYELMTLFWVISDPEPHLTEFFPPVGVKNVIVDQEEILVFAGGPLWHRCHQTSPSIPAFW